MENAGRNAAALVHALAAAGPSAGPPRCTVATRKLGFHRPNARRFTGVVHVLDIGAPRALLRSIDVSA